MANRLKTYLSRPQVSLPLLQDANDVAQDILHLHAANGGSTFSLYFGSQAGEHLYSVSLFPERSLVIPGQEIDEEIVRAYIEANEDLLRDPRCCVGTWYDPEAGETYLDVAVVLPNKREVILLAKRYNQIGMFDLFRMEYLPIGGSGKPMPDLPPETERLPALRRRET